MTFSLKPLQKEGPGEVEAIEERACLEGFHQSGTGVFVFGIRSKGIAEKVFGFFEVFPLKICPAGVGEGVRVFGIPGELDRGVLRGFIEPALHAQDAVFQVENRVEIRINFERLIAGYFCFRPLPKTGMGRGLGISLERSGLQGDGLGRDFKRFLVAVHRGKDNGFDREIGRFFRLKRDGCVDGLEGILLPLFHAEVGDGELGMTIWIVRVIREEDFDLGDRFFVPVQVAKVLGAFKGGHVGGAYAGGIIRPWPSGIPPVSLGKARRLGFARVIMNLEALKAALAASPDNVPLLLMVAEALEDSFELEESREILERVLSHDPTNAVALVSLARILDLDGATSQAIVRVESLCQSQPNCGPAWLLRARLAFKEGEVKAARGFYEKAIECDASIVDEPFLQQVIRSGGTSASEGRRVAMTSAGHPIEEDDDDDLDGLDAVAARDLGLEFQLKVNRKFSDVGGMEDVKEDIRMKIIHPLKNPELFAAYGKKAGGGVLMYGPPGCGKTLLSQATAGEINANFFSIGLHQVLDMYIGESEQRLHKIFELARKCAPSVLFFDEIDALAADRRDLRGSAGRTLINQFLAELDGAQESNDGVLILGATNAPWHLDSAFLRPGRFDRLIFVPPPDQKARCEIINIQSKEKPMAEIDDEAVAKKAEGFSGADIKAMFDLATESKLEEAMKKGKIIPVTGKDLIQAAKKVKPSTRKWFESAKNYALYANQSGFYDDVLTYMGIKK